MNDREERNGDDPFAMKAKAAFDQSVESLDGATLSRLNQSRHRALEHGARQSAVVLNRHWMPAAGVAGAAAVAVAVWTLNQQPDEVLPSAATDLEIILELDDFEMLEDLEFYSWVELDEQLDAV